MYRIQMEPSECIEISIWRKCPECKGLGARIIPGESVNIVVVPREVCTWCHGFGRQATFIPIDQLANPDSGIDPLALVRAIKDWLLNQPEQTARQPQPEPPTMVCPKCGGGGGQAPWDALSDLKCDRCGGSGQVPTTVGKDTVAVCSICHRASCLAGIFYCEEYKQAGITLKPRAELEALALESPDYWEKEDHD